MASSKCQIRTTVSRSDSIININVISCSGEAQIASTCNSICDINIMAGFKDQTSTTVCRSDRIKNINVPTGVKCQCSSTIQRNRSNITYIESCPNPNVATPECVSQCCCSHSATKIRGRAGNNSKIIRVNQPGTCLSSRSQRGNYCRIVNIHHRPGRLNKAAITTIWSRSIQYA